MLYIYILCFIITLIIFSYIYDKLLNPERHNVQTNYQIEDTIDFPFYDKEKFIPNKIYRIYGIKDNKDELNKYNKVFECTKKNSPRLEENIIFGIDEIEKFVLKYYNQHVLDIIRLLNYNYAACVSDVIRLLVIYAKGGVYLDIKSSVIGNISEELDKYNDKLLVSNFTSFPFIHSNWTNINFPYGEISNWFFAAPKGHPVIREAIIKTLSNIKAASNEKYKITNKYILDLTGPFMFTKVIKNTKHTDQIIILRSFNYYNLTFTGWLGKLRKNSNLVDNKKVQGKSYWKKLDEPLFVN